MTLTELSAKAEHIKGAFAKREENRKRWHEETQPLLTSVLNQIAKESGLDLQVQTLDWTINNEGVNLLFNPGPSGMYTNPRRAHLFGERPKSLRHYVKHGGYIVFAQAYNGEVFVLISFPSVEEYVFEIPTLTVGKYSPSDISESFI